MRSGAVFLIAFLGYASPASANDPLAKAVQEQQWPAVLDTLQSSRQLADAHRREPLLYRQLQQMLNSPVADPVIRDWVGALRGYRAELRRPANPEHPASPLADSYPIAELAAQLLDRWQTLDDAEQLERQWRSGDLTLPRSAQTLTAAIDRAEPDLLQALLSAHAALPTPALAAIARRLNQSQVHRRWLMQASDDEVISALPTLADSLGPAAARDLIHALRSRPALRGPASLAMAELAAPAIDDQEIALWIEQLGDPGAGASSARALAQLEQDHWVRRLPVPASITAWQNSLLALHWSRQPAARAQLMQWLATDQAPEHMRTELSQWLR